MCFWALVETDWLTMGHQVTVSGISHYELGPVTLIKSNWDSSSAIHCRMETICLEYSLCRDRCVSKLCEQCLRPWCYRLQLHSSLFLSSQPMATWSRMARWRRKKRFKLVFWIDRLGIWVQVENGWQLHSSHTQGRPWNTTQRELQKVCFITLFIEEKVV